MVIEQFVLGGIESSLLASFHELKADSRIWREKRHWNKNAFLPLEPTQEEGIYR
jgi:hypothetical protein